MRCFIVILLTVFLSVFSSAAYAEDGNPKVLVETNMGNFEIELFQKEAPKTVRNFLTYARSGFYDGTIFHRVIKGFVIQGGGFDQNMQEKKTRPPIRNEADNELKNKKYTLSMARTSLPHSATSQFFINLADNTMLDYQSSTPQGWGYAVFGRVTYGRGLIDNMGEVGTRRIGPYSDVPSIPIIINKMTVYQ